MKRMSDGETIAAKWLIGIICLIAFCAWYWSDMQARDAANLARHDQNCIEFSESMTEMGSGWWTNKELLDYFRTFDSKWISYTFTGSRSLQFTENKMLHKWLRSCERRNLVEKKWEDSKSMWRVR